MGNENKNKNEDIKIDYENIDVEDIMEQIKKKIASQPRSSEPEPSVLPEYHSPQEPTQPQPEGPLGKKAKIKSVMLKIFKPISPLIKFLVLPVHQELKDTIQNLHATNQRIDFLERRVEGDFSKVHQELRTIIEELNRVREYTQLLHNLSHNIVVELTKLKIEQENLKLKTRIMEKDFEFLGKREKTLEGKVFG
jgi:hypothetical protein